MTWLIAIVAIIAGCLNTVQAGSNLTLHKTLGDPIFAALVVTATGAIVYLGAACFIGLSWPGMSRISQVPWWAWIGGSLGALYVLTMIFLADRLGAAVFTGLTVTAAIVTSVTLDHFGWIGFKEHPASLARILGCILMIGGLTLVSKF